MPDLTRNLDSALIFSAALLRSRRWYTLFCRMLLIFFFFASFSNATEYYVNDGSVELDEWCSGIGDDLNDGLSAATPKATVQAIIDSYDLEPGDVVHIDTGDYILTSNIEITEADEGSEAAPVVFEASSYGVTISWDSLLDSDYTFNINNSSYITIRTAQCSSHPDKIQAYMILQRGAAGVLITNSVHCIVDRVEIKSNSYGISAFESNFATFSNNLIHNNISGGILLSSNSNNSTIINNTIVNNSSYYWFSGFQIHLRDSLDAYLKNNIIMLGEDSVYGIYIDAGSIKYSNYNLIYAYDDAGVGFYNKGNNTLLEWQVETGWDSESISINPGFIDSENDNYHLKSTGGSYHASEWINDTETSPGIDTGDPEDDFSGEPNQNGSRINLGAYGNTEFASNTPSGREIFIHSLNGDEVVSGTFPIRWVISGLGWQSSDTVKIEYSGDNGDTWSVVSASIPVSGSSYMWDTTLFADSLNALIRITCNEDTGVSAESAAVFHVHNIPVHYYVNDGSVTMDEWCTGGGYDENDGLTPANPKATVQAILDTYDLEQGDVVHIDTGVYILASNIEITEADQGTASSPVIFEASPFGVVIDRNSTSSNTYAFYLNNSAYITIRTASSEKYAGKEQFFMNVTGGYSGVYLDNADYSTIKKLEVSSNNYYGIRSTGSSNATYSNNLIHHNGYNGILLTSDSDKTKIINNTITDNDDDQIYVSSSSDITIKNNIIWAEGSDIYAVYCSLDDIEYSDYNLIYADDGAYTGYTDKIHSTLIEWQNSTGYDLNSISFDPVFVDADNGDYHLKSSGGSYHNGEWGLDSETSPGIDMGNPSDVYNEEPEDNGGRINLGAYGGTDQASKISANRELILSSLFGGEIVRDSYEITWLFKGNEWENSDTVMIEYSSDNGETWTVISGSVLASDGSFLWDTSSLSDSPFIKIRITFNNDNNIYTQSNGWFYVHNGPIEYYVNDDSVDLDEWCTEAGNDSNDGLTPATPKASVQAILDSYDLEDGDVVHIDTGTYFLTENIEVTEYDQGSDAASVVFEASPYGVVIDRDSSGYVFDLNSSDYITVRTSASDKYPDEPQSFMKLTGATQGVYIRNAENCVINRLEISSNSNYGITSYNTSNVIYSNNLIHDNGSHGISLSSPSENCLIVNNTIYNNGDKQIYIYNYESNITLKNNIIWSDGAGVYGIYVNGDSEGNESDVASDYNLIYATNGAYIGYSSEILATLEEWQTSTERDTNSFSINPMFVDSESGDYHLKSSYGSYHNGVWTADTENSFAVDSGDPSYDYSFEPDNNGDRINLGAYGNTEQASKSPSGRVLILTALNGSEIVNGTVEVTWLARGQGWQAEDTVTIEYSDDNGEAWNVVTTSGGAVDGSYSWDTSSLTDSPYYKIRIIYNDDADISSESISWFYIHNESIDYYVNDSSAELDEWCTAIGDDENDGLTPAAPKATVQNILDTYDLEPGDVVHIDTGNYDLSDNIEITGLDQGSDGAPVIFEASPYGVVIDRGSRSSGRYAFYINSSSYITIRTGSGSTYPDSPMKFMELTGGYFGVYSYLSDHLTLNRVKIAANSSDGIYSNNSDNSAFYNNIISDNGSNGVNLSDSDNCILENNTIVLNRSNQIYAGPSFTTLKNNIIWADGSGDYAVYSYAESLEYSDYNILYATSGAYIGYFEGPHSTLKDWQAATGKDINSISAEPIFIDAENEDYHLKSKSGSYHNGVWDTDDLSSPGIDFGDPSSSYESEPEDNGDRINLGAYGGTEQASKSLSGREILLSGLNDGAFLQGTYTISWRTMGTAWQSEDTLIIEYSNDNGVTWNVISSAVPAEDGYYLWDTTSLIDSPGYMLRITYSGDKSISTKNESFFYIHNGPINYYVNDGSLDLDEWCTEAGDDANDGLTPASPKATVQAILDTYDLEPGDEVHIDTGTYTLTGNIQITEGDQGSEILPVIFEASPYGVVIDRDSTNSGSYIFYLNKSNYVMIRTASGSSHPDEITHLATLTNAKYGIYLYDADYCEISGLKISSNLNYGIYAYSSLYGTYSNNIISDNGDGLYLSASGTSSLVNNTIVQNDRYQIYMSSSSNVTLKNNIISTDIADSCCIYLRTTYYTLNSDYNLIYAAQGASTGYYGELINSLADWQSVTGNDTHSISQNPVFVDYENGDFHLKSTGGRYQDGSWIIDTESSPGIDTGISSDNYSSEPETNGNRINLGAYGGTEEASKSPAERLLFLTILNGGEILEGSFNIKWVSIGQDWQNGDNIKIEYSADNGETWNLIAESVSVADDGYLWDTSSLTDSPFYKVRITGIDNSAVSAESADWFYVHNGPIHYYVNDTSTDLDEWCSDIGDDTNNGTAPAAPKATVQSIIDTYQLIPGDIVHIDTGNYYLTNNIEITESDQGTETAPVIFEASPYGVSIDRESTSSGDAVFFLNGSDYITVRTAEGESYPDETRSYMKVTGGYYGLYLNDADYCTINKLEIYANSNDGIYSVDSVSVTYSNNLIYGNLDDGIYMDDADDSVLLNNTVVQNSDDQVYIYSTNRITLKNNIIWADGSEDYCIYNYNGSIEYSDYNLIYATNSAYIGYYEYAILSSINTWQNATGEDENSNSFDPGFVDVDNGDYHLKSTGGSYSSGLWYVDSEPSSGIDTGDPSSDYSSEPENNGNRINIGAYGGTDQASKSPSGRELFLTSLEDGEVIRGISKITWLYMGQGWGIGDTLTIEYSGDNGATWNVITESAIAEYGYYLWDSELSENSPYGIIRITSNQDNDISKISESSFYLHNGPIHYYINDDSTNLDEWCTDAGNDLNDGLTPATPKATVQAIIDAYDLMMGDIVHIDTGTYYLLSNIIITESDQGEENAPVILEASPFGVVFDRSAASYSHNIFYLDDCDYITIRTAVSDKYFGQTRVMMNLTNGSHGVYLNNADYCSINKLKISSSSSSGIYSMSSRHVDYSNNLLVENGGHGIDLYDGDNSSIVNNTILGNNNAQVYISATINLVFKNNIIQADGQLNYAVYRVSGTFEYSDYNLFYTTGGAYLGYYNGSLISLSDWQTEVETDANSLWRNPAFVDPDDSNYHLTSTGGSYKNGTWSVDQKSSPGIDTGDPSGDYSDEPVENGSRVNLGAYGCTDQASKSPDGRELILLDMNGGEIIRDAADITWLTTGQEWESGDTVKIEYSSDNGSSWNVISESVSAEDGFYSWDTASLADRPYYLIRVTSNDGEKSSTQSESWFYVHNGPIEYYVNDSSTYLDEWCKETGNNSNDGLTPATPKATVQAILGTYDLEEGDTVHIDTGNYSLTANIEITEFDQGSENAPVIFEGSPYGVTIDRGSISYGDYVFYVDTSDYVTIRTATSVKYDDVPQRFMKLTGGYYGMHIYDSEYLIINRLEICSNYSYGLHSNDSSNGIYSNNIINKNGGVGFYLGEADNSFIVNNTIQGNDGVELYMSYSSNMTLKNNIILSDAEGDCCIYSRSISINTSDYNLFYTTNGAYTAYYNSSTVARLEDWQNATDNDFNSLSIAPGFVDSDNGNYHLKSTGGSYHYGIWTADAQSSPGINMGDPEDAYDLEPVNNGDRINLGAYGGTEQASKHPDGRELILPVAYEGQIIQGDYEITWILNGTGWESEDTLIIEYSNDNGATWSVISTTVTATDGSYSWDTSTYPDSPYYLLRITSNNDEGSYVESDGWFYIHNQSIEYYVNDNSTELDVWCTAIGDDANDGLTPASPKSTVQSILDTYDLEGGDVIHIDTGNYTLTDYIHITESDQGDESANVILEGSPYGVIIEQGSTENDSVIYIYRSDYITVRTGESEKYPGEPQYLMMLTGGYYGIYLYDSDYCTIKKLEISDNLNTGLYSGSSEYVTFANNLVYNNGNYGISAYSSNTLVNNTVVKNDNYEIYMTSTSNVVFKNNIIWADGSGDYGVYRFPGSNGSSDYNLIYATDGAYAGYYSGVCSNLADCQAATGDDLNSLSSEPGFVDPENGDYHLKSTGGSYQDGSWIIDLESSPGIDMGDPSDDYSNEPEYNGDNINLGAFGNTVQASKSPSGRELIIPDVYSGMIVHDTLEITWKINGQNWETGDTLTIEYSSDNGTTWNVVSETVLAEGESYLWDTSSLTDRPYYIIRLKSNEGAGSIAVSDGWFYVHNGPIEYYVNDGSTDLDEWCTGIGDDTNDGLTPASPKATVQDVLDTYDLEEGDVVHIDTGMYSLSASIEITQSDQGKENAHITFEASPYGVVIDRGATESGEYVFYLNNSNYVNINTAVSSKYSEVPQYFMKLGGANVGILLVNSNYCVINRLEISSNAEDGIYSNDSSYVTYSNNLIHENGEYGIYLFDDSRNSEILNNTLLKNGNSSIYMRYTQNILLKNNIILADGSGNYAVYCYSGTINDSDYNIIYAVNSAHIGYYENTSYTGLSDWSESTGFDANSFSLDPGFVNPDNGDYHLKSSGGSYHENTWATDTEDSPGLDTADPEDDCSNEPVDNGERVNIGAYGCTEQASKSPSRRALILTALNGGEVVNGTYDISWLLNGQAWSNGDTITLEYSIDNGLTWTVISENIPAEDGYYAWDTAAFSDGALYKLKLTSNEDTDVSTESSNWFYVHNGPIYYYVNDASTDLDEWCTGTGDDENDGLSAAAPKATVQGILDTYNLEPGDVVHIDTGNYILTENISITEYDQGADTAPVIFEASPYGVVIDRNSAESGNYAFFINNSYYVTIRTAVSSKYTGEAQHFMKITGGNSGIYVQYSDYCTISNVNVSSNLYFGIRVRDAGSGTYSNNLIYDNGDDGIYIYSDSENSKIVNNTIVKNGDDQINLMRVDNLILKNNIIWADGSGDIGIRSYSSSVESSDYNLIYATNGAYIGYFDMTVNDLADWQTNTGMDANSISIDPGFVDPDNGDFHLKSTGGSYHDGLWSMVY